MNINAEQDIEYWLEFLGVNSIADVYVNAIHLGQHRGGYFIFSQEHPLTTASISGTSWAKDENGNVLHYKLTDYSRCGKRSTTWIVDGVEKYHRTFSKIINSLC